MTKYQVQRSVLGLLLMVISMTLSAQDFSADRGLFEAYQREDMSVWEEYLGNRQPSAVSHQMLIYEYGYCGYIVAEAKKEGKEALLPKAKRYVQQFRSDVEAAKGSLPAGHYEMYMSAVYVYELRTHESFHPARAMSLAKQATKIAPKDPLVLAYYGTSLFYAPKPFGSKREALDYFERAEQLFRAPKWKYCWVREATLMYIGQCKEKIK